MKTAAVAGEFVVERTASRRVDGTFPVTDVTLRRTGAGDPTESFDLILPGGVFDGVFEPGVAGAFRLDTGESVYALLEPADGFDGKYVLFGILERSLLRQVSTAYGDRMLSTDGRVVASVDCAAPLSFAVEPAVCECVGDADVDGSAGCPDSLVPVEEPTAWGGDWSDVVQALDACGGAR